MFLIVPKRAHPALGCGDGRSAAVEPTNLSGANARTQSACDGCRLRKTKCDGRRPCSKCRARQLVCVFSRSAQKATGPVSADHLAVLQHQRQRLIGAVRRMAVVINELQADKEAGGENRMPLPDATHGSHHSQGEDIDITEILNQYAPEPASSPTDEHHTIPQSLHTSKKRRRQDLIPTDPAFLEVDDLEPRADESGGSSSTDNPTSFGVNPDATVIQEPLVLGDTSHLPFMRMLQNYNMPGLMTNGAGTNPMQALGSGASHGQPMFGSPNGANDMSTTENADAAFNASFAAPDAPWDASMAPLLEMVDWNASLQSCWEYYENEQNPPLGGWVVDETMF